MRLSLDAPAETGITVRVCVHRGRIALYASTTSPNPSAALHEWSDIVTAPENQQTITCHSSFYDLNDINVNEPTRDKRQTKETTVTLYISIEGQDNLNEFQLSSNYVEVEQGNSVNNIIGEYSYC